MERRLHDAVCGMNPDARERGVVACSALSLGAFLAIPARVKPSEVWRTRKQFDDFDDAIHYATTGEVR